MENKKIPEKKKCEKCGCSTWMFLIKDHKGRTVCCNHCPKEVSRVMKFLARRYFKLFNGD